LTELVHCHAHNHNSLLDGAGTEEDHVRRAAELGMGALAETNHGTLAGSIRHLKACRKYGIVPLLGVEAYFRPNRLERNSGEKAYHQVLIAKNATGWKNLLKLTSIANDDQRRGGGFYNKPCTDWDLQEQYHEGLICTTACVGSYISQLLALGDEAGARTALRRLKNLYRDDLFMEIQPHDFDLQREVNIAKVRLAREESLGIVATADVHFPESYWTPTQEVLLLTSTSSSFKRREEREKKRLEGKSRIDDTAETAAAVRRNKGEDVFTKPTPTAYLMTADEMRENFAKHHPHIDSAIIDGAIANTYEIASRCVPFLMDKSLKMPKVTSSKAEALQLIRKWVREGLKKRFGGDWTPPEYLARIETELEVIERRDGLDYLIIYRNLVKWLQTDDPLPPTDDDPDPPRKEPVPTGPGRGSAAGSLVVYLLGITKVDPLPYGLLFERFLNPDRKGMPDIDLDMVGRGKDLAIEWLRRKHGYDRVAEVSNFARFTPKAVLNAVGTVFDIRKETERVNATFDIKPSSKVKTLQGLREVNKSVRQFAEKYPVVWEHCLRLEGQRSQPGIHASAVVVADRPLTDVVPLQPPNRPDGYKWEKDPPIDLVTAYDAGNPNVIEDEMGLVKWDLLGVDVLDRQEYVVDLLRYPTDERQEPIELDLDALPCMTDPYAVDPEVMQAFADGDTDSVFQFGSAGMRDLLRKIKPQNILELAAANALYRPGAMDSANDYSIRKFDPEAREYWAPELEPILKPNYGLLIYQEDLMKIVQVIGNFTPGQADDMRKAMGKLYRSGDAQAFMQRYWSQWVTGTAENGVNEETRDYIWQKFLNMGDYGLNLSHAVCYALLAYRDMLLKVKHRLQFSAAVLTKEGDESIRMNIVRSARDNGVPVLPPRIGVSKYGFTVSEDGIHFGYHGVKGIGEKATEKIIDLFGYGDIDDFKENSGLAKNVIEALEECGALDNLGGRRGWDPEDKQRLERLRLGIALSAEPVDKRWGHIIDPRITTKEDFAETPAAPWRGNRRDYQLVIGGEITSTEVFKVKKEGPNRGRQMARFQVAYKNDTYNCIMFPQIFEKCGELLTAGVPAVLVRGVKDSDDPEATLIVDTMTDVSRVDDQLERMAA